MLIKRYDLGYVPYENGPQIVKDPNGDYVSYDDYVAEKVKWVTENNRLHDLLNEINEIAHKRIEF